MSASPDFTVACDCGKTFEVSESAAGTRLSCDCGRQVAVPSLRELRQQQGVGDQTNPVLRIEYLLAAKALPAETICAQCEATTDHVLVVYAQCERSWRKGRPADSISAGLLAAFSPLLALISIASRGSGEEREFGRDIHLSLPLRLCVNCEAEVRRKWGPSRRRTIQELLRRVPLYRALLERYPRATIREQ